MDVFLFQVLQSLSEPPYDHSPPSIFPLIPFPGKAAHAT